MSAHYPIPPPSDRNPDQADWAEVQADFAGYVSPRMKGWLIFAQSIRGATRQDAEDGLQQALVELWKASLHEPFPPLPVEVWMRKRIYWRVTNVINKRLMLAPKDRNEPPADESGGSRPAAPPPQPPPIWPPTTRARIQSLPDELADTLIAPGTSLDDVRKAELWHDCLRLVGQAFARLSHSDQAAILGAESSRKGKTAEAIRQDKCRARKRLRGILAKLAEHEEPELKSLVLKLLARAAA